MRMSRSSEVTPGPVASNLGPRKGVTAGPQTVVHRACSQRIVCGTRVGRGRGRPRSGGVGSRIAPGTPGHQRSSLRSLVVASLRSAREFRANARNL